MLLSVCIPTFNRCSFIRLSAAYWLEQMEPFQDRVELIVADNASTDETLAVLKSFQEKAPFLRIVARPENLGFNRSVHDLVVHRARGRFVWVCGDDDYLNAETFGDVVALLERHGDEQHFYVRTQFVPEDHPPNLDYEDPRESAFLQGPGGDERNERVPHMIDLLSADAGGFSGFYSSIWRREMAVAALSGEFLSHPPFTSLEATLPYAVFIARHRLKEPCFRIGKVILTVVHTISWPQYASFFRLKIMPEAYDCYERHGCPGPVLRPHRQALLEHWPLAYLDLFRRRGTPEAHGFSYLGFLARHTLELQFWRELFRAIWCDLLP